MQFTQLSIKGLRWIRCRLVNKEDAMKKHRYGEIDAFYFDTLPQRCKEIFFYYMSPAYPSSTSAQNKLNYIEIADFGLEACKSPIEKIFAFAVDILCFDNLKYKYIRIIPQEDIWIKDKHYIADFIFNTEEFEELHFEHPFKLIIECDGHEYHNLTKKQVAQDNNRDFDLKNNGYDVIHFSGSQLFTDPFECATKVLDYICEHVGKITKKEYE